MMRVATALVLTACLAQPAVAAPVLQMHRAVYDLSLGRPQPVSDVAGISGRMVIEWRGGEACGGYTSLQRVVTHVTGEGGGMVQNDVRLSFWEAADGNEFRFTRTEYINGDLIGTETGTARHDRKAGKTVVEREGEEPIEMQPGVLFPTAYNLALMQAVADGKRVFSMPLFDGTEKAENPTTVFIGNQAMAAEDALSAKDETGATPLAGLKAWPVRIGYFDAEDPEGVPSFEMGYALFPNGVSTTLTLDYLDVELKGALSEVTYFKPGAC